MPRSGPGSHASSKRDWKIRRYTLPLRRVYAEDGPRWQSGSGSCAASICFSIQAIRRWAIGCRSIPCRGRPGDRDEVMEDDPWRDRSRCRPRRNSISAIILKPAWSTNSASSAHSNGRVQQPARNENWSARRYVLNARRQLYVFMPPTPTSEDYIELVAAVEATAKALHMPVMLEGYAPPFDPRLVHFKVTPDPGVIEVNIHPSANWSELVQGTTTVYEEARQSACAPRNSCSTATHRHRRRQPRRPRRTDPAEQPILRRPDLYAEPGRYCTTIRRCRTSSPACSSAHQPGAAHR